MNWKWKMNGTCQKNCLIDAIFSRVMSSCWFVWLLWCHNLIIWTNTLTCYNRKFITGICYCQVPLLNSHFQQNTCRKNSEKYSSADWILLFEKKCTTLCMYTYSVQCTHNSAANFSDILFRCKSISFCSLYIIPTELNITSISSPFFFEKSMNIFNS